MRRYDMLKKKEAETHRDISLFEVSYYAESYGFSPQEFDKVADLAWGETFEAAGLTITRIDKPE